MRERVEIAHRLVVRFRHVRSLHAHRSKRLRTAHGSVDIARERDDDSERDRRARRRARVVAGARGRVHGVGENGEAHRRGDASVAAHETDAKWRLIKCQKPLN